MINNKSWVRLPIYALKDERLTKSDTVILAMLIDIIDDDEEKEISIKRLSKTSGISDRQVIRAVKKLTECNYIEKIRIGRTNLYKLKEEILPPKKRNNPQVKNTDKSNSFVNNFETVKNKSESQLTTKEHETDDTYFSNEEMQELIQKYSGVFSESTLNRLKKQIK